MMIKISDLIADFFVNKGCDTVFTVTGGGAMHLNDSLGHKEGFNCIYNHNEQGCSVCAEGYARTALKPAVVCVTSGPGGTNALTGVMGAWVDSIPMFVVSGQVKFTTTMSSVPHLKLRQLGDQEYNIVDSARPMTKYCVMVDEPNDILYHLEKAWHLMSTGRKGPVWLDIPLNVQGAKVDTEQLRRFNSNELPKLDVDNFTSRDVAEVLNMIKAAKKPVIFVGAAIDNEGYAKQFNVFAERLNIPVVTAWNAHDLIDENHELYCGRPGTVGNRAGNFVVQKSDLLLVIGSQLNIRQISYNYENFAKDAKLVLIDFDRNEINKPTINVYKSYCVDLKDFIDNCLADKNFIDNSHKEWLSWCKEIKNKYSFEYENSDRNGFVNPYVFMDKFSDFLEEDDTIICSNGSACVVTFQVLKTKFGQRLFTNSGCASMGYGLPASIGGAIAKKGKRVICMEGDGSLQMNIQELATLKYNNLNLKMVVLNNNGYHSIRQTQSNLFKHHEMCGVSKDNGVWIPSMQKIAAAYELNYFKLSDINDAKTIHEFLKGNTPSILEVMVDENQNFAPKLSSRVLPDGTIISPPIDDMYPFMDRAEYENVFFEVKK